jgi:lysozyme family protein
MPMGSNAKKKTTFAKLNREATLRDRRARKEARKAARKLEASAPPPAPLSDTPPPVEDDEPQAQEAPEATPAR